MLIEKQKLKKSPRAFAKTTKRLYVNSITMLAIMPNISRK